MHDFFLFVVLLLSSLRTNAFSLQVPSNAKLQAKSVSTPSPTKLPFLVQQLGKDSQASKSDAEEISEIVISVFFEEEAEKSEEKRSKGSITKPLILAYLKNLQYGDVRGKKFMLGGVNNSMFVARQIIPCNSAEGMTIGELNSSAISLSNSKRYIFNTDMLDSSERYTVGDILGFVDVTEKAFGLPSSKGKSEDKIKEDKTEEEEESESEEAKIRLRNKAALRPVLTNLSVTPNARKSGVGSALVDVCEDVVIDSEEWTRNYNEMILEVEEENNLAQEFYEKRGYVAVFKDPSSRRFDTSGLILNNVRTTKICYRKDLTRKQAEKGSSKTETNTVGGLGMFFAKIKEAIGIETSE